MKPSSSSSRQGTSPNGAIQGWLGGSEAGSVSAVAAQRLRRRMGMPRSRIIAVYSWIATRVSAR
jgi:hypothetical protein